MENLPESPFSESTLGSSSSSPSQKNPNDLGALNPNQLVLLIHDASLREEVMHHLYEEVTSEYRKFSPSMLSMKEATRVCCALALFQVLANNPETRRGLIKAKIPCYFYPFLKPCEDHDEPLEHFDDPYGSHALHFFLESEVVPLCLKCMDVCDEMSRKVATLIVMNILTQERGLTYCCATPERFFAIVQVLRRVVEKLSPKPCLLHLEYVIQCYVCLSKIFRSIGPCDAFVRQIPPQLFDNTFRRTLLHDHEASWMLQVLHLNIYGCLYFPPIEERKKIAKKAASSSASSSKDDQIEMSDEDDIDLDISEIQQFHGSPQRDMSESGLKSIEEQPVEHEGLTTDVITGVACVIHLGNLEFAKGTGVDLSVLKVSNSWFHSNTKTVALDSPSSLNRFTIVMS
uniref:Cell differentiation protein rcd1 n=1 Tax=Solanum tuberosum TaxID=4113 RepID=M0ZKN9_SOLTU